MTLDTPAAVVALHAHTIDAGKLPATLAIGTDTRAVAPGSTFLALRGERFDGHAFVAAAFERGAAACIVADAAVVPSGRPALVVDDTLRAYLAAARLARANVRGPVIAISGSAGKTTTKAFLLQLLQAAGAGATGTPENENNEVGVSKFLLGLAAGDERIAVVEMGARKPDDIDVLVAAARPDISVLTNIGDAHLEIFGSPAALAHAKWGLFRAGARAVLNLDDAVSRERVPSLVAAPLWFGTGTMMPPPGAGAVILRDARTLAVIEADGVHEYAVDVHVPGEHNRRNLAAALAAAIAAGVAPDRLAPAVAGVTMPAWRYETIALDNERRLIFDAYNASLSGTLATLAAFAQERAARRIAVLGSMAELGADAARMHREVGAAAAQSSEIILAGGDFAGDIVAGAGAAGAGPARVLAYDGNAAATAWLRANARPGDAILLKGSRKYKMEEIVAALRGEAAS